MKESVRIRITKFYTKYGSTISLNKGLLVSGLVGFIVSLVVAYLYAKYSSDNFNTSAVTVITGFIFSKVTFVILFHLDNRRTYTKGFTGKLNFPVLKQIVRKGIFADSIFDTINNVSRFLILLELLITILASTGHNNSISYSLLFLLFSHKFNRKKNTCIWF